MECNAAKEERWLRKVERRDFRKNRVIMGLREAEERGEMGEFRTPAPKKRFADNVKRFFW